MFKRLGILAILIVMALMVSVPAVAAQGGPPPDRGENRVEALVTGSVGLQNGYHANFNVRMTVGGSVSGFLNLWDAEGHKHVFTMSNMIPSIWPGCTYINGFATKGFFADGKTQMCVILCDDPSIPIAMLWYWDWDEDQQEDVRVVIGDVSGTPVISGNIVIKD